MSRTFCPAPMASDQVARPIRHCVRYAMPSGASGSIGCWISIFVSISIPHAHLRRFLDQRVTDGVIRRMIDKWLKAGVVEDGHLHHTTAGSPQGGVISPCLSNVYLHYVLD